jgi:hypothetical protein
VKKIDWIKEEEAAQRLGMTPRTLRINAKSGRLDISYTNINGRNYFYSEQSIEKLLLKNAVLIQS